MTKEQDTAHEMLQELLEVEGGMTPWEVSFIDDIDKRTRHNKTLSPKQIEMIKRIYTDRV